MIVRDKKRDDARLSLCGAVRGAYNSVHRCSEVLGIPERKLKAACVDGELERLTVEDLRKLGPLLRQADRDALREWVIP